MGKKEISDKVSLAPNSAAGPQEGALGLFPLQGGSVRPGQGREPHRQDHRDHQDHQRHVAGRRPDHQGPPRGGVPPQQGGRRPGQGRLRGEVRQNRAQEEEEAHR